MNLAEVLSAVGAPGSEASFSLFAQHLDPTWVEEALRATGTATIRKRKLPAEYAVWLVIGMALFRDRAIEEVVRHLDLVLPTSEGQRQPVTGGGVVQARDRLGPEPLARLFHTTAGHWATASADAHRWRGLAVLGVDGTTLRVPDAPANEAHFGRPGTSRGEAGAGYPQLRLVTLMVLRSHLLWDVAFAPYGTSESSRADQLWPGVPEQSVVIFDRGFAGYTLFHTLADPTRQRYWLTRAKQGATAMPLYPVEELGEGDTLVELRPSKDARKACSQLPEILRARAITYQRKGASGPSSCSPPCSIPSPSRPTRSSPSTTNAGNSNWPTTRSRPTPWNAKKPSCAARAPSASPRNSGDWPSPTTSCA